MKCEFTRCINCMEGECMCCEDTIKLQAVSFLTKENIQKEYLDCNMYKARKVQF